MKPFFLIYFLALAQCEVLAQGALPPNMENKQKSLGFDLNNPATLTIEQMRMPGRSFMVQYANQVWEPGVDCSTLQAHFLENKLHRGLYGVDFIAETIDGEKDTMNGFLDVIYGIQGRLASLCISHRLRVGMAVSGIRHKKKTSADTTGIGRYSSNIGLFYLHYDRNKTWNWSVGIAAGASLVTNCSYKGDQIFPRLTDAPSANLVFQGGANRKNLWLGLRYDDRLHEKNTLLLSFRAYLFQERFIVGADWGNNTPYRNNDTFSYYKSIAGYVGWEWFLNRKSGEPHQFLTIFTGFSTPLREADPVVNFKLIWTMEQIPPPLTE